LHLYEELGQALPGKAETDQTRIENTFSDSLQIGSFLRNAT
jgi:hypothetical protein